MQNSKEQAIQQVKDNNPDDYARLYSFAEVWVQNRFKAFTSEDLKAIIMLLRTL